jgi:phosphatidate phosphatase APP1
LHHDNAPFHASFFTREFLTKNKIFVVSTHPIFLFTLLKIKLKCRHFDTIEVIVAEWKVVLNTLTEHDFQGTFKKMAEAPQIVQYVRKGTSSRLAQS